VYRSISNRSAFGKSRRVGFRPRPARGAITPFIAMAVILMMGMLGVCIDLTRDFEAARQLKFAAQSAALYGLSLSANTDGTYSQNTAINNIQTGIITAGNNAWNVAQFGPPNNIVSGTPQSGVSSEPVAFAAADVQFVNNALDPTEFFVQLTARRQGADALQQYFLPLLYTSFNGPAPQSVRTLSTHRVVEVLGQPATRIGAGAPLTSQAGSREFELKGFATLPLAISYNQFAALTNPALTNSAYTIDLVTANTTGSAVAAGHIKGCLVNVSTTGNPASFYGTATGATPTNQLLGLLNYFGAQTTQQTIAPAVVERGSSLFAFDPAQWTAAQQSSVAQALATVQRINPRGIYILPVLQNDPNFANGAVGPNQVIGFAHLQINGFTSANGVPSSVAISIVDTTGNSLSVPVRNSTSAIMASITIPAGTSQLMPPPPATTATLSDPFLPRTYDPNANTVSMRPRGIVMAPALSPRQLAAF
jgi:Flp pilus assembly protein TadG